MRRRAARSRPGLLLPLLLLPPAGAAAEEGPATHSTAAAGGAGGGGGEAGGRPRWWVGQVVRASRRIELRKAKGRRSTWIEYGDIGRVSEVPGDVDGAVAEVHFFRGKKWKENRGVFTDVMPGQVEPVNPDEMTVGSVWEQQSDDGEWYRCEIKAVHGKGNQRTFDTSMLNMDFNFDSEDPEVRLKTQQGKNWGKKMRLAWGKDVSPQSLRRPALTEEEWLTNERWVHFKEHSGLTGPLKPRDHAAPLPDAASEPAARGDGRVEL